MVAGCQSTKKTPKRTTKPKPKIERVYDNAFDFYTADELDLVLSLAKKEEKLVFVDIYASWCLPCQLMDDDVFTDAALGAYYNEHFVSYKQDVEHGDGPIIKFNYDVSILPTLLFLDADGNELVRKTGAAYPTEMRRLAKEAMAKHAQNLQAKSIIE